MALYPLNNPTNLPSPCAYIRRPKPLSLSHSPRPFCCPKAAQMAANPLSLSPSLGRTIWRFLELLHAAPMCRFLLLLAEQMKAVLGAFKPWELEELKKDCCCPLELSFPSSFGLQRRASSFKKGASIASKRKSYVLGSWKVSSWLQEGLLYGALEGEEEEEMESFIHGFLKEEDDGSWHPLGEEEM